MNKTKTIYFLSAIVLIIGCYALNLSYSLFVQTESKDIVNATVPVLSYNLEQNTFGLSSQTAELITLKINNTGTTDINYGISATVVGNAEETTIQLVEKTDNYIVGTVSASTSKEVLVYVTAPKNNDIHVVFNLTATYSTVAIPEDFVTTSNIDTVNTVKLLNESIIANAKSTESTYENKTVYSDTLLTTPAEEISGETERLLLETEDDYTASTGQNSYYFRGNVIDNYVNFAGMCWRIVRIAGDGSIKLILDDQYTTCDDIESIESSAVYTGNWIIDGANYGYEYKNVNQSTYYENIMNYLKPSYNEDNSMIKAFYDFQTTKLTDYTSKLKSGDWCLGDKAYTGIASSGSYTYTPLEEYDYSSNMYYDSYVRLVGDNKDGYQPTLKCTGTTMNSFQSVIYNNDEIIKIAPMYVGAITADEIVYAGGKYGDFNSTLYLINKYFGSGESYYAEFWSLSPYAFYNNSYTDTVITFDLNGSMVYRGVDYRSSMTFRPVVSLASITTATTKDDTATYGEPGTQTNPYVIG